MAVTEEELVQAGKQMAALRKNGYAVSARYDRGNDQIVVELNTGVHVTFVTRLIEGLSGAPPDNLGNIEISPAGIGLHWPRLDADVHVPALLQGVLGSRPWMAAQLIAADGSVRTGAGEDIRATWEGTSHRPADDGGEC